AVFYSGPGPAQFLGTLNDTQSFDGVHPGSGFAGGRRATSRWAAMIYETSAGGSDPQVDRAKVDDSDCDAASAAAPCFVVASSHNISVAATWSPTGNIVTVTGGLVAHSRPFVVGMNTFCSGCNSNLTITSVSAPPTQSTVAGQGQVGNTFTFTVQNPSGQPIGGTGSGSFAGGCAGTSGVGSNCIDIPISINVTGLGSPALDTCGSNTMNGSASGHVVPTGKCQGGQIGDLVRGFRIGTVQQMNGDGVAGVVAGSVFDDGMDPANGTFNQSAAFTCNIVAAKLAQCVKAPLYTAGVFTSIGKWASGSTYLSYGDAIIVASRVGTLMGYAGDQSFPFTPGSGYTNGTTQPTVTCSGGTVPKLDVTVSGGAIVNVVPSAISGALGQNLVSTCSVALPSGGSGGAIPTITLAPVVGVGGIGTYNTDNNAVGAAFLYDNSCLGPLSQFFATPTGACFEPGLPVRPFGQFQGLAVSG
ncbi:MAG TPA: hypothetical protein VNX46_12090, partial [Candidatus Acidoferrum sp.]|nr:hypothetical protein [Candidatus Acidoferrum sp.]